MKKAILVIVVLLLSTTLQAQKNKKIKTKPKSKITAVSNKKVLAKTDNVTAELFKSKEGQRLYLLVVNAGTVDTVHVKLFVDKEENIPGDVKITPFNAKGAKLHSIVWIEKNKIGEPKTKLEEISEVHTEIFDLPSKINVYSNTQKTTNITEVVFLDKVKVVSETQQKVRREGMQLTVLPDGDLLLKNKQSEGKYTYKPEEKKFVAKK